ncbi:MAG: beta-lactamase family protein [Deltaproteobacteria bacterium]|nr:beta-lactamase family protein [Deltaproteobacteria bacterium]
MRTPFLLASLFATLLIAPGCAGNCKVAGSPEGQALGFMAQYAADMCVGPYGGPGLTVTLTAEDETLGIGSAGEAGGGIPLDGQSPFRLGTLSEVYTAALVSRLVDQGRLSFADPVTTRLPWAVTDEPVTLRQLLAHRSGIKDVRSIPSIDLAAAQGPQALAQAALDRGSRFSPGEKYGDSATDYLLLGLVVEAALAQEYGEALHQNVLDPFGLGRTFVDGYEDLPDDLALGHDGTGAERDPQLAPENGGGAFSVVSNGTDIERFLRIVFEDEGFLTETTRLEFAFPADGVAGDAGYGFGVHIGDLSGDDAWSRAGEHPSGYGAAFVYLPELKSLSVALTNARPSNPGAVAELGAEFTAAFTGEPVE